MPHAKVSGECSNCHTMHNSQAGASMATYGVSQWGDTAPFEALTRGTCLGCHGQGGTDHIKSIGNIPQVYHTGSTDLAGGNFYHILKTGGSDTFGHNVADIDNVEGNSSMFPPPGDQYSQNGITSSTFTCAGQYGCHGNRSATSSFTAMKGAHHTDDTIIDGSSTGTSYRFLKGVLGLENPTTAWRNVDATDHNEYKGVNGPGADTGSATSPANETISGFCEECHGYYHGTSTTEGQEETGSSSPWLRHPTDIVLPSTSSKEYQYYNGGTGGTAAADYSILAPLARPNLATIISTSKINPGTDIIMCLSCHGAHATNFYKLMRWDYKNWPPGTNGCNVCHTSKN